MNGKVFYNIQKTVKIFSYKSNYDTIKYINDSICEVSIYLYFIQSIDNLPVDDSDPVNIIKIRYLLSDIFYY